ncbi:MAG: AraC family transcriptional regulator, partial [Acetatifactor sp.]|nr:AraC family transcriptional regulator [Acetatifactor sp.]
LRCIRVRVYDRHEPIPAYLCNLAEGYLELLLADLFTSPAALPLQRQKSGENLELEQRVLLYLDRHFTEELSLDLLAKEFGVSRFHLSRLFSEKFQTTFPRYVNSRRLEYARELLAESNDSVTNIALDAGFGSSRSFFREFREAFHMTPNAYRRRHIRQAPRS